MQYNTKLELLKLTTVEDGQGGYSEQLEVEKVYYANKSAMNMELSEKLFGKVSLSAINVVINNVLDVPNNASVFFRIDNKKYDLVKSKVFRNKTHLYLEVIDNE